ncbi:MAG: FtsX-like permease family protein [Lachnospiraceae bacterium]
MKKKALRKDFYMEIVKSLGRFVSIFFIVALGVAFFSGIRASEPDMRMSGDAYFDRKKLMDVKVLGMLGITETDLDALKQVEGVAEVEGGYSTDALCEVEQNQKVVHIVSDLKKMNKLTVSQGRLPQKEGECLVDQDFFEASKYQMGGQIKLESGTEDPLTDTLKKDVLTIVGVGSSPSYISFGRGSSTIGTGEVKGYLIVSSETFSMEVYSEAYMMVKGAAEQLAFTKGYEDKVEQTLKRVEDIADTRCTARRQELVTDAQKELDKAKKELQDGKAEVQTKLAQAQATLTDGENQLNDGKNQIASGQTAIAEAKNTLSSKQQELKDAKAQYQDGVHQLETGKQELATQEAVFQEKEAEAQAQFATEAQNLQDARNQLDAGWAQYQSGHDQMTTAVADATAGLAQVEEAMQTAPPEMIPILGAKKVELEATITELQNHLAQLENSPEKQTLDAGEAQYQTGKQQFDTAKADADAQLNAGRAQLDGAAQEINQSQTQLDQAGEQITSGQSQIDSGWAELNAKEGDLAAAQSTIAEKETELADGKAKFAKSKEDAEKEIAKNEKKITDAEEKIRDIEHPTWYVEDRNSLPEYSGYGENSDRMRAIGRVFPVLFFLVAALISLTTMTRMVEEQRTQIGTLKALGYSKISIAGKYINYALIATLGGSIFGVLVGEKILPYIIIYAYKIMYQHMPDIVIPYNLKYASMATIAALCCTLVATIFSCGKELAAQPAVLMRPPTPKQGKRVFLERITFVWRHLNFIWKSTIRNLIRYKKRFFMTVFGIGGCMALMIVGFGLKDSIFDIAKIQYDELQLYSGTAYTKDDITEESQKALLADMGSDPLIENYEEALMKNVDVEHGKVKKKVYMCVPDDIHKVGDFIVFRDRTTKQEHTMEEDGAILTEKMAKTLHVKKGDSVDIKVGNEKKKVIITDITENYMGHYIYVSPKLYENIYNKEPKYNSVMFKITDFSNQRLLKAGGNILEHKDVLNVSYNNSMKERLNDMLKSLNLVIVVLIISAGMLAFVVLYNLNNINITERQRELATIKVLGFYDTEVAAYVYRENILLTLIGALAGVGMGIVLHRFIIVTVEIEEVMFGRNINWISFLYSILFTLGFSAFVNWVMYFKLKRIDMVESLKSVE